MTISSFAKVTVQFSEWQASKNLLISRKPPKSSIDRSVMLPFLTISSSPCILSSLSLFSNPIPCLAGHAKLLSFSFSIRVRPFFNGSHIRSSISSGNVSVFKPPFFYITLFVFWRSWKRECFFGCASNFDSLVCF